MRDRNASVKFIPIALVILVIIAGVQKCSSQSNFRGANNQQKITPKKYTGKIIAGSILFVSGIRLLGLTIFAENYHPVTETFPKIKKPGIALGFSLGATTTAAGAMLLAYGLNQRNIYKDNKRSVSIICSDRIGISYNF